MKKRIVSGLETLCDYVHWFTNRRPYLWFFGHCPLARLSDHLDQKWETGVWEDVSESE